MSKAKKPDLAHAVHGAARPQPAPVRPARSASAAPGSLRAPSRQGKRGVLIHVSPELSRRLRQLALDEDTTLQALGLEALERLLEIRGR